MPVTAAGAIARPVEASADRMSRGQLCALLAAAAVGVALVWLAVRSAPHGGVRVPARATEDVPAFTPPAGAPVIGPNQHAGGVTYLPHRYPNMCGADVSALIWHGHRPLLLPHERDTDWLTAPPSEVTL
jgi:hypothetical protein